MRILSLALAAVLVAVLAGACGSGGGDGGDYGSSDYGESIDFVSADPQQVLGNSAQYFREDVQSLRAEMDFAINVAGLEVEAGAEMEFQAPDQMHMTMTITGLGTYEALIVGDAVYASVPPMGWVSFSLDELGAEELGVNVDSFTKAFDDHSPVDYTQVIESLGGEVENLGEETIDGQTYQHYRGTVDFAEVVASFADGFGATDGLNLSSAGGPLTLEIWVDTETVLPHKAVLTGDIAFGDTPMTFDATLLFLGYNEPVDIPAAPEDAVSLSELFSGALEAQ
jgi:hypothetical protein